MVPVAQKKKKRLGFTLVELMVVVVIVGVLASVAVPTFTKFSNRARESEAPTSLRSIADGARLYFYKEHLNSLGVIVPPYFPGVKDAVTFNPSTAPCAGGTAQYPKNPAGWSTLMWKQLKFSMDKAHYFRYAFTPSSAPGATARYTATAQANLDCDSTLSTFRLLGRVDATTGELVRSGIIVTNAGE